MSVHTTNDANAVIAVAEDCPVDVGTAPPERTPALGGAGAGGAGVLPR